MTPYTREVTYLSPSSFRTFERDPIRYYLEKLGPEEYKPPRTSNKRMSVGSEFDELVKRETWRALKPESAGAKLKISATDKAAKLLLGYIASGAFEDYLALKPTATEVDLSGKSPDGVPLFGKADVTLEDLTALDWKTRIASDRGVFKAPTPGYSQDIWLCPQKGRLVKGPHVKSTLPMHETCESWAIQLTFYRWCLKPGVVEDFEGRIDQVIEWRNDVIRVCQYRQLIPTRWQSELSTRLRRAWDRIQNHEVVEPELAALGVDMLAGWR